MELAGHHRNSPSTLSQVHRKNVLKDFVQVAGPLGVTHFLVLSRTEEFINLRVCRLPRGPTITFHIKSVSGKGLCTSVQVCSQLTSIPRLSYSTCSSFVSLAPKLSSNFPHCKCQFKPQNLEALSPGPTQIFLQGCEIKSGWGLRMRLKTWRWESLRFIFSFSSFLLHVRSSLLCVNQCPVRPSSSLHP